MSSIVPATAPTAIPALEPVVRPSDAGGTGEGEVLDSGGTGKSGVEEWDGEAIARSDVESVFVPETVSIGVFDVETRVDEDLLVVDVTRASKTTNFFEDFDHSAQTFGREGKTSNWPFPLSQQPASPGQQKAVSVLVTLEHETMSPGVPFPHGFGQSAKGKDESVHEPLTSSCLGPRQYLFVMHVYPLSPLQQTDAPFASWLHGKSPGASSPLG